MRGEEDLLGCILRLDWVSKQQATQAEHHAAVLVEELRDEDAGGPSIGTAGSR